METISRGPGASLRRAEVMRTAWGRVERHGSAALGPTWGFLSAHPTLVQGVYYVLTGLWPLLHVQSFLAVTGPKTDLWLVQTVGALIAVIGAALGVAAYRRRLSAEIIVLALGCAGVLMVVDVVFVMQHVISAVYLLDAAAEAGLLTLWAYGWSAGRLARIDGRSALPVATPLSTPIANTPR